MCKALHSAAAVVLSHLETRFVNRDSISTGSHKWLTIHYHHDVSSCVAHLKVKKYKFSFHFKIRFLQRDQFKILASDLDPREVKTLPSRRDTVGHGDDTKYALVFGNEEVRSSFSPICVLTTALAVEGHKQSNETGRRRDIPASHVWFCSKL